MFFIKYRSMSKAVDRLGARIKEELAHLNNTAYYYFMKELSEWAESEAESAELGWRNHGMDELEKDD